MTENTAPRALRANITIIGRRNAGKSSLINALIGQEVAIVSPQPGTTTDAVAKAYELLPLGPVTFYDTAGLDDEGELGSLRIKATRKILFKTDLAVIVVSERGLEEKEKEIIRLVANGYSNKEIAAEMYLGEGTVRNYLSSILDKLQLRDRTQVAVFYYKHR